MESLKYPRIRKNSTTRVQSQGTRPSCALPTLIAHVLGSLTRGVGRCVSRTFGFESCFLGRFTTKFSVWGCLLTRYYGGGRDSCCRVPVPQYYCAVVPVLQYRQIYIYTMRWGKYQLVQLYFDFLAMGQLQFCVWLLSNEQICVLVNYPLGLDPSGSLVGSYSLQLHSYRILRPQLSAHHYSIKQFSEKLHVLQSAVIFKNLDTLRSCFSVQAPCFCIVFLDHVKYLQIHATSAASTLADWHTQKIHACSEVGCRRTHNLDRSENQRMRESENQRIRELRLGILR